MREQDKVLYAEFLKEWGYEAQSTMLIEEMAELTQALCKYKRKGYDNADEKIKQNLLEELADVQNMLEQLIYHFGEEKVEQIRQMKLQRTKNRLIEWKNGGK